MGPRIREDTDGGGMGDGWGRRFGVRERGWVPASARTRVGGDGRRPGTSLRGTGEGMGPRIREDTDGGGTGDGWGRRFGVRERGWVPASARTRVGGRAAARDGTSGYGRGDGSPHPRGHGWGGTGDGQGRRFGVRERGWVPAFARTRTVGGRATAGDVASGYGRGDGSPHPRGHGWGDGRRLGTALRGTGEGMGPRIREDTGGGGRGTARDVASGYGRGDGSPHPRGHGWGGRATAGDVASGYGRGDGSPHPRGHGWGDGGRPGTALRGTVEGMGPRIREDTDGGGRETARDVASGYGRGDGSPHPRGYGWGGTGDGQGRRFGVRERGWVPASARTRTVGGWATAGDVASGYGRGDGSPHPRGHGWGDGRRPGTSLRGTGEGMGPRIREDTGGGTGDGQGRRFGVRKRGWVPASARTRVGGRATARDVASGYGRGDGSPHP